MTEEKQNTPQLKPETVYAWAPEAKIEISGVEYSIIQKTLAMFEPALAISQTIFARMLKDGTAKEQVAPVVPEIVPAPETPDTPAVDDYPFTEVEEVVKVPQVN